VRADRWHAEFAQVYDRHFRTEMFTTAGQWDPVRERICVCDDRYYPFLGSRRQFDVCRPLWTREYAGFLDYLHRNRATIVVARNLDPSSQDRYLHARGWVTSNAELFTVLYGDHRYTAARVNAAALAAVCAARHAGGEVPP
jgi:hypothetical protein